MSTLPTRWLAGLIEWEDSTPERRRRFTVGSPTVVALGAAAFMGMSGLAMLSNAGRAGGSTASGALSAPNAPTINTVFVVDTSTWHVTVSAFVGSGSDAQDSLQIQVDTTGGSFSSPRTDVVSQTANLTDTLSDNTDWNHNGVYIVRARVFGTLSDLWSNWSSNASVTNTTTDSVPTMKISNWASGTGRSRAAVMDSSQVGGPWTGTTRSGSDNFADLNIVTCSTYESLATHVAEAPTNCFDHDDGVSHTDLLERTNLTVVGAGQSRYHRAYVRLDPTVSQDIANEHGWQACTGCTVRWWWWVETAGITGDFWSLTYCNDIGAPLCYAIGDSRTNQSLAMGTWYRIEWAFHRHATNATYKIDVRVTNVETNTLLYDDDDFGLLVYGAGDGNGNLASNDPSFSYGNATEAFGGYTLGFSQTSPAEVDGYTHAAHWVSANTGGTWAGNFIPCNGGTC